MEDIVKKARAEALLDASQLVHNCIMKCNDPKTILMLQYLWRDILNLLEVKDDQGALS